MTIFITYGSDGRIGAFTTSRAYATGMTEVDAPDDFDPGTAMPSDYVYADGAMTYDPLPQPGPTPSLDQRVTDVETQLTALGTQVTAADAKAGEAKTAADEARGAVADATSAAQTATEAAAAAQTTADEAKATAGTAAASMSEYMDALLGLDTTEAADAE